MGFATMCHEGVSGKNEVIQKPNQLLELGRIGNQHDWSRPSLSSWMFDKLVLSILLIS